MVVLRGVGLENGGLQTETCGGHPVQYCSFAKGGREVKSMESLIMITMFKGPLWLVYTKPHQAHSSVYGMQA